VVIHGSIANSYGAHNARYRGPSGFRDARGGPPGSGTLYAVEDKDDHYDLKWQKPVMVSASLAGGGVNSVASGILYLQENTAPALVGRSVDTGEVVWSFSSPGNTQPAIGSGLLFDYSAPFMRCWGRPVSLHIEVDKPSALPGDMVTYVLTANSYGGPASAGMTIVETMPAEMEFAGATGGGIQVGNMVIWQGVTILKDTLLSVTLTGRVRRDLAMGTYDVVGQGFLDYPGLPGDATECLSSRVHTTVVQNSPPPPPPYRGRVRVYPNPFSPARAVRGTVKFEGLPAGRKVRIYTPSGLRVWEGKVVTAYMVEWDGKTESGKPVAPGAYQWVAEGEEGKDRGTLIME
jgi:hypothetical protein